MTGFWKKRRETRSAIGIRRRRSLLRDERGAVIVEFGFVAAPFLALIFATLISAAIMFSQQALDTMTEDVAREIMTGQIQKGTVKVTDPATHAQVNIDSNARLRAYVCAKMRTRGLGFLDCANVMVSLKKLASFSAANYSRVNLTYNAAGAVTNAPGTFDTIGQEEIGLVTVYYRWPKLVGPLLGFTTGNQSNGERLMVSNSVFKTETYNQ